MVRTVLKLAFVALLANATWHLFGAYAPNYKFKDSIQYVALHRGQMTDEVLLERILELAVQYDVPVTAADVSVTHDAGHTIVHVAYVRPVDLAPRFTYPWPFSFSVDVLTL